MDLTLRGNSATMARHDTADALPGTVAAFSPAAMHPGFRLAAELAARGLTANAFALKPRVPANRISEIIRGRRAISAETALRIGQCLGCDPLLWVDLQARHDLAVAASDLGGRIARDVEPV